MEIRLPDDFKEFLRLLNSHEVEYLVIGGYAVGYHGYPRATNDLDIWIAIRPANAERMVAVLREFGFETSSITPELFLKEKNVVRMGVPPLRLEVLTTISGVTFEACYRERLVVQFDEVEANLINLSDLRRNKKASGRHRDLDDLEHLP